LKYDADVHTLNDDKQTAFHLASYLGHSEVKKELLGCEADLHASDRPNTA